VDEVPGPVSVRVTWTPEDHWALTQFSVLKTPLFRRVRTLAHVATAVVFAGSLGPLIGGILLAPLRLSVWRAGNAQFLVMLLFGAIGWGIAPFFYMHYARWRVAGGLKNVPGVLGEQRIAISAEGIHRENVAGEETTRWSVITDVAEDADHLYLYAGPAAAYIFPRRDLSNGQQRAVASLARTHSTGHPSVFTAAPIPRLERAAYILGATVVGGAGLAAVLLLLLT
jgi:hypothetical protein